MNHLMRALAPITEAGWKEIDSEAKERLNTHLAARRLVDVSGPHGWTYSATELGRTVKLKKSPLPDGQKEAQVRQRRVLPLAEVRVPFAVSREELDDAERGADDLEFEDLDRAAKRISLIENRAVFHGWAEAGMTGITDTCPYDKATLGDDAEAYPGVITKAVDTLRRAGIAGPYGLAIGPTGYTRIVESTEQGELVFDHLQHILDGGKIVRAAGLEGAVVLSLGGGDFVLDVGQDLSVGYSHHDSETVTLYLEESFSFRVTEPDAAITLNP
ncbi:bacteriocin [Pseudonocardiaceae bacterium YIM PH 21723]|nr:bacteriocin [Pseudonocardiaceae bacterium YIM PH 21723]